MNRRSHYFDLTRSVGDAEEPQRHANGGDDGGDAARENRDGPPLLADLG